MKGLRVIVLWLTGCDLLAPEVKPRPGAFVMPPAAMWKVDIAHGAMVINTPNGPNALHRLAQRIVLGFKWEALWRLK